MDWKMKKQLLEKYWKGETSPEEEGWLKANVSDLYEVANKEEAAYFDQLNQFSEMSLDQSFDMKAIERTTAPARPSKTARLYTNISRIAAIALVLVAMAFAVNSLMNEPVFEEPIFADESEKEAFELARQSLLLISSKLNKGIDCASGLEKFNEAHAKIKAKEKNVITKNN